MKTLMLAIGLLFVTSVSWADCISFETPMDCMTKAKEGDAWAQSIIGSMYRQGHGAAQDYKEAVKWYQKAAEQGNAVAQNDLGVVYAEGLGMAQDYKEAVKWYREAAEQGYPLAQYNLGFMYTKGRGVDQDHKEAVKWYRKAVEQGYPPAQNGLGTMYAKGEGVLKDYIEAHKWFNVAGANGNEEGSKNRDVVANKMTPEQIQEAQKLALKWMATREQNELPKEVETKVVPPQNHPLSK